MNTRSWISIACNSHERTPMKASRCNDERLLLDCHASPPSLRHARAGPAAGTGSASRSAARPHSRNVPRRPGARRRYVPPSCSSVQPTGRSAPIKVVVDDRSVAETGPSTRKRERHQGCDQVVQRRRGDHRDCGLVVYQRACLAVSQRATSAVWVCGAGRSSAPGDTGSLSGTTRTGLEAVATRAAEVLSRVGPGWPR